MISVEKPGSPSEILEHAGVKGMKWGVRRQAARSAGREAAYRRHKEGLVGGEGPRRAARAARKEGRAAGKAAAKEYRQTAREARAARPPTRGIAPGRSSREFAARFPTSASRTQEIHRARVQEQAMRLRAASETNPAKREKLVKEWRDSPDRAIALRTTRGEKVALGVLAGVLAVPSFGATAGALAGYSGTTAAIRTGIERKQAKRARMIEQ